MVKSEVIGRVLRILINNSKGSCFTLEHNKIQYIVTAKHLFEHLSYPKIATIQLLINKQYQTIVADVLYHTIDSIDIVVLRPNPINPVTLAYNNTIGTDGVIISQDVFFLGFPYDYEYYLGLLPNSQNKVPFVKKAVLSGICFQEDGSQLLVLDGHNNQGFSGGPLCANIPGESTMKILGVISGFRFNKSVLYNEQSTMTNYHIRENSGIIHAYSSQHAIEIIENTY